MRVVNKEGNGKRDSELWRNEVVVSVAIKTAKLFDVTSSCASHYHPPSTKEHSIVASTNQQATHNKNLCNQLKCN
jgi:hypothetical protein